MGRYRPCGFGQRLCSSSSTFGFFSKVGFGGSFTVRGSSGAAGRDGRFFFSGTFPPYRSGSLYHKKTYEGLRSLSIESLQFWVDVSERGAALFQDLPAFGATALMVRAGREVPALRNG